MDSFKVILDRIEEGITILLVSDEVLFKINILFFCYRKEAEKATFWILPSLGMCKRQRLQKKE